MHIKNEITSLRSARRSLQDRQNHLRLNPSVTNEMSMLNAHVSEISQNIERATLILRTPQPGDTLEILQEKIDDIQSELEIKKQRLRDTHPVFKSAAILDFILTHKTMRGVTYLKPDQVIAIMNECIKTHNKELPDQMELITGDLKKESVCSYLRTTEDLMTYHDRLTKKYSEIQEHSESESIDATYKAPSRSP